MEKLDLLMAEEGDPAFLGKNARVARKETAEKRAVKRQTRSGRWQKFFWISPQPRFKITVPLQSFTPQRTMSDPDSDPAPRTSSPVALAFANLLLRLWVGLRLFMAGVDKFREGNGWGSAPGSVSFSMDNYAAKTGRIAKLMTENSFFPKEMCEMYAKSIGYVLLAVGVWVVVGLFTEVGLLLAGLTVLSLGLGLAALPDDTEVVYIGIHVLIIAAALATCKAKQISLDGLFFRRKAD